MHRLIWRPLAVLLSLGLTFTALAAPTLVAETSAQEGAVTVEWLGWNAWRVTSPTGKVVLLNPLVGSFNTDAPISHQDITRADLILVTNGHGDEVGHAVEIAQNTGARIVTGSWTLGGWFIERGVPAQQLFRRNPGDRVQTDGITIRGMNGIHGSDISSPTERTPSGGITSAFFITFENGWTLFYGGSSAATLDQGMWASVYRPHAAIVHLGGSAEPMDFAMQVKLLMTDNPNLRTVFPGHHFFVQPAGQTTIAEAQAAVDSMGLGIRITEPAPGQPYRFGN